MATEVFPPTGTPDRAQVDDPLATGFDFGTAVLGGALPPQVEALVSEAGWLRQAPGQAEALLLQALALAPDHPVPLIALYRFHFYGHRLREALQVASRALQVGLAALGPQRLEAPPSDEAARFDPAVRFVLFVLKGYAYLNLRVGDLDGAAQALAELRRLDPGDHVGGAVLAQVLARAGQVDAEDPEDEPGAGPAQVSAVRGWVGEAQP